MLRDGQPVGGVERIEVEKGDTVRLRRDAPTPATRSTCTDTTSTREAAPGKPARFRFKANIEGVFEIESHTAEDAGREPLIARLVVEPA